MDRMPTYSISRPVFVRFFNQWAREAERQGRRSSGRALAAEAGVSHTLIQQIISGRDSNGATKTHVNMETARAIEAAFDAPAGLIFRPDMEHVTRTA